jgi:type 1 glutamine amidotransferase
VHSASDTEYSWSFYTGSLVGASFAGHPVIQQATLKVDAALHPAAAGLPANWVRIDEWYNFSANVRSSSTVVLTLDETTYDGGTMGADHPIAWAREVDAGRAFYTALGHTDESYAEEAFLGHLKAAIEWAAKRR